MLTIRPMVQTDLNDLGIPTFGKSIRAQVAEVDGVPIAASGVIHTSPHYAFAHLTDAMRDHKRDIVRVIQSFSEFLQEYYDVVFAIADINESNAPSVLERAGFRHYQSTTQGEVYRWLKSQSH